MRPRLKKVMARSTYCQAARLLAEIGRLHARVRRQSKKKTRGRHHQDPQRYRRCAAEAFLGRLGEKAKTQMVSEQQAPSALHVAEGSSVEQYHAPQRWPPQTLLLLLWLL